MNRALLTKIVVLLLLIILGVLFVVFDAAQYMELDYIKSVQTQVTHLYLQNRPLVLFLFGASYTMATALSLPGAGIMTVAAGGFFGLLDGTVVVSISSTLGASLAFLLARFLFKDMVQSRFGDKLLLVNEGIAKEGGFYLFTLRLIPIFPFFMINLLMGLTSMRLRIFAIMSFLGMLPATIVFVNAGRELAKIDSLGGILSPSLIVSFVLIGLLPLVAKKMVGVLRTKFVKNDG